MTMKKPQRYIIATVYAQIEMFPFSMNPKQVTITLNAYGALYLTGLGVVAWF